MTKHVFQISLFMGILGVFDQETDHVKLPITVQPSSGYNILYGVPHIGYRFHKTWDASTDIEIPLFRYYNGVQLGNKFSFSLRITYQVNLRKKPGEEWQ